MENLKDFIDENRKGFEEENLIPGHKNRFFVKLNRTGYVANRPAVQMNWPAWAAAAAIVIFLLAVPLFVTDDSKLSSPEVSYSQLIKNKSEEITKQALLLNPSDQNTVLTTLGQLEFESVPFEDQLPDSISPKEKDELMKSYYGPKLEGIERLEKYVAALTKI
jgi:hypothetical protein